MYLSYPKCVSFISTVCVFHNYPNSGLFSYYMWKRGAVIHIEGIRGVFMEKLGFQIVWEVEQILYKQKENKIPNEERINRR